MVAVVEVTVLKVLFFILVIASNSLVYCDDRIPVSCNSLVSIGILMSLLLIPVLVEVDCFSISLLDNLNYILIFCILLVDH